MSFKIDDEKSLQANLYNLIILSMMVMSTSPQTTWCVLFNISLYSLLSTCIIEKNKYITV